MQKFYKEEKGVVSIAMAILIPVIIIGVLYVYAMLNKPQQENTVHKVIYASSEAYLSRYNAYLFDQMGILANLDSGGLNPLILHYLVRNKLIENSESAALEIKYEHMSMPNIYNEAITEASNALIGNAILDYGIDLLDQFAFAEKIRALNQSIENYEKKLSEQFDKSGATQFLRTIKQCDEVQSGKREIARLEGYLNKQYETFFKTIDRMESELARVNEATSNPRQTIEAFIEAKEAQWRASEVAFMTVHQDYLQTISIIEALYESIESESASARRLADQIDDEKAQNPIDYDVVSHLESLINESDALVEGFFTEIDAIISDMLDLKASKPPSIIALMRDVILEADYLFSGVAIGSGILVLEDSYKYSSNYSENSGVEEATLPQKMKLNEYFLSIFSSYDLKCPRAFDPQNRHKGLRTIKGEVEYLISGLANEKHSLSLVRLKIVAVRSAANIVTLLCDKDKLARLSTATVALPQPWRSLAYGAGIAAWSGLESYSDINRLMKGEGFYFFKTQSQWALDFDALLDGTWKNTNQRLVLNNQTNLSNQPPSVLDPNMYYMDYLRLLLLMQRNDITLLRAMDLVESELLSISEGETSLVNYSRGHDIKMIWKPHGIFGFTSIDRSSIHMRNGYK